MVAVGIRAVGVEGGGTVGVATIGVVAAGVEIARVEVGVDGLTAATDVLVATGPVRAVDVGRTVEVGLPLAWGAAATAVGEAMAAPARPGALVAS